ncbi:MAG: type II toxin-antitoxin system prevent-host-death family antitoxin [Firmicutes bacterium]|nr:type II toxin-antitoxin system prevent-host-death family antitoxin [Bacillota bacterium]
MARTVNVHQAKTHLSQLLEAVRQGEDVIIARAGKPIARLTSLDEAAPRRPGGARGLIHVAPNFDAPLPEELLRAFER